MVLVKLLFTIFLLGASCFNLVKLCPNQCYCRENKLNCKQLLTLTDLEAMDIPASITEVHLINNKLKTINANALKNFQHVFVLQISNNGITSIPKNTFVGFKNLQKLLLNDNEITNINRDSFNGLVNLRRLELQQNRINSIPKGIFSKLTSLQVIHLQDNLIKTISNEVFTGHKELQEIFLFRNKISSIEDRAFQNLSLYKLMLSENNLKSVPVTAFQGLKMTGQVVLLLNPLECDCKKAMNYAKYWTHLDRRIWGYCKSPDYAIDEHILNAHESMRCTLCDLQPCKNGGTCHGNKTHYQCKCTEKYKGELCEINLCNTKVKQVIKFIEVPGKTVIKYIYMNTTTAVSFKQMYPNRTEYIIVKENIINRDDQEKLKILYAMCSLEFVVIFCFLVYFSRTRYKDWKLKKKYEHEKSRKILLNIRNSTNAKLAKSLCQEGNEEEYPFDVKSMVLKGAVPV